MTCDDSLRAPKFVGCPVSVPLLLNHFKEGEKISVSLIQRHCKMKFNQANAEFQSLLSKGLIVKNGNFYVVKF